MNSYSPFRTLIIVPSSVNCCILRSEKSKNPANSANLTTLAKTNLDKLVTVSLPRVRDFHGVPTKSFDGRGNYTLGVKEQLIFPEINYDDVDKVRGMDIVIVTTANTDEESRELLAKLGMPFAK